MGPRWGSKNHDAARNATVSNMLGALQSTALRASSRQQARPRATRPRTTLFPAWFDPQAQSVSGKHDQGDSGAFGNRGWRRSRHHSGGEDQRSPNRSCLHGEALRAVVTSAVTCLGRGVGFNKYVELVDEP